MKESMEAFTSIHFQACSIPPVTDVKRNSISARCFHCIVRFPVIDKTDILLTVV